MDIIDESGKSYGKWTVLHIAYKRSHVFWWCRCECGKEKAVSGNELRSSGSTGCRGCSSVTHGFTRNGYIPAEYNVYKKMIGRCFNQRNKDYHNYGGRGISVCKRWLESFVAFLDDMGYRPSPKHTIERVNNNGDYCKDNCVWLPLALQARNTRKNIWIELDGEQMILADWLRRYDLTIAGYHSRRKRGMSISDAIKTPHLKGKKKPCKT